MSNVWFDRESVAYFDESYTYKGYALVNEIYEDDDHRSNTWMWGKVDGNHVTNVCLLEGMRSNSYATYKEAQTHFKNVVDNLLEMV
jgi:hypothetical protein